VKDEFVITSPTASSVKNWISQGLYAEHAVILAELFVDGESKGPHLFWAPIADRAKDSSGKFVECARPVPRSGVTVNSLPNKTVMLGLDNAEITFNKFRIPRSSLLNRFCSLEPKQGGGKGEYEYKTNLPKGIPRMLDLLIFRLLTGRIQLSEGTVAHAQFRLRANWAYCQQRELWRGKKPKGKMMSEMPLIKGAYRDYGRTLAIINAFIANTREVVADSIRKDGFTYDTVEATCMCKYLGTGFGVDCVSAVRKLMGARALQSDSYLDKESFLPNATSAAGVL
jgi:acyl-CoA oxidase